MGLEILNLMLGAKHIEHFTEHGIEKIEFDKRGDDKLQAILKYVNEYCTKNNMRILSVEHNNATPVSIVLVDN